MDLSVRLEGLDVESRWGVALWHRQSKSVAFHVQVVAARGEHAALALALGLGVWLEPFRLCPGSGGS